MTRIIKKWAPFTLAAVCICLVFLGLGHYMEVAEPEAWRTRTQQMRQLDRIEAKVTTILYEQSKRDAQ